MNSRTFVLVLACWLTLLLSGPVFAQVRKSTSNTTSQAPAPKLDVQMILTSDGGATDSLAVAYGRELPDSEIQGDFAHLAGLLRIPPPQVKITRDKGIPAAEAKVPGLTNWNTGEVVLDPLVDTFKRFGFFRLLCFFMKPFPLRSVESFTRPPLRVEVNQSGPNVVSYQIWVDQSAGVPTSLPAIRGSGSGMGSKMIVGLLAVSLVAGGAVFLIIQVVLGHRKQTGRR